MPLSILGNEQSIKISIKWFSHYAQDTGILVICKRWMERQEFDYGQMLLGYFSRSV